VGSDARHRVVSDFDPLGGWDVRAPLLPEALAAGIAYERELPSIRPHDVDRGYLHVSAGPEDVCFGEYTANVTLRDDRWTIVPTHDPRKNALSTFDDADYAAATYHRNKGSWSICADAMLEADPHRFGADALQLHQVEHVCAAAAALCVAYGIDPLGLSLRAPYAGEPTVLTHAEAADRVGVPGQYEAYGPSKTCERWDFLSLVPLPADVEPSAAIARRTGDGLRTRIAAYMGGMRPVPGAGISTAA